MNAAKAELLERNRQLLEQMEKLRKELEQSRKARQPPNASGPQAAGAPIPTTPMSRLCGRKTQP